MPSNFGALNEGLLSGIEAYNRSRAVHEMAKRTQIDEFVKNYSVLKDLSKELGDSNLPLSYKQNLVQTYNDLATKVFGTLGVKPPIHDGNFEPDDASFYKDLSKGLDFITKANVVDSQKAGAILQGVVDDIKLKNPKEKQNDKLSALAGGIASRTTNPAAQPFYIGTQSPAPVDYSGFATGTNTGTTPTPDVGVQLPSDMERLLESARMAIGNNAEGLKQLDEAKKNFTENQAAWNLQQAQTQPTDIKTALESQARMASPDYTTKQIGPPTAGTASPVLKTYIRNQGTSKEELWTINEKDASDPNLDKKLTAGKWKPYSQPTMASIMTMSDSSLDGMANDVLAEKLNYAQAQKNIGLRNAKQQGEFLNILRVKDPNFNPWQNAINAKYIESPNIQDKLRFMDSLIGDPKTGAGGQIEYVKELSDAVDRTQYPIINKAILKAKKDYTGDVPTANFMAGLYNVALEAARASAGTGSVVPQERVDQELERVSAAYNKKQLNSVLDVVRKELLMRREKIVKGTPGQVTTTGKPENVGSPRPKPTF